MKPGRFLAVAACLAVVASCTTSSLGWRGPDAERQGAGEAVRDLAFSDAPEGEVELEPAVPDLLRVALARPDTLDPARISLADQSAVIAVDLLYDGLTEVTDQREVLGPALALSWSASEDLRGWRFQLDPARVGVTVDAVVAHFQGLVADPPSPAVAWLLADVEGVVADGDATVEFVLSRPNGGFPWLLSSASLAVMGEGGAATGRFRVAGDGGDRLVLEASGQTRPMVPGRVEIRWTESADDAYRLLTMGVVDAAVAPPTFMADARSRFAARPGPRAITRFYGMNPSSAVLADKRLRQAVLAAVDRDRIAREVSAAPAVVVDGVVSPATSGHRWRACGVSCRFDRERASALVAEVAAERAAVGDAIGGGGEPLVLHIATGSESQRLLARALADDLDAVGFQTVLVSPSSDEVADTIDTTEADLFAFGWVAPAGSVDAVIPALLGATSPANGLGLDAPVVDQLIERASRTADDQDRWWLLQRAHALALADQRILPLTAATSFLVTAPQANGLVTRADGSIALPTP